MVDPKRIKPAAPRVLSDRVVDIPPTVQEVDNSPTRPPTSKTRADFRPEEFVRILHQHGKFVTWTKAMLCPCQNETTNQALLDCTTCDGSGYFYVDPIDIRAHMAMFDKKTSIYEKFGMWVEGATAVTCEPQYRLHYRDRITMKDSIMPMNELLKKGNRRGIRSKLPTGVDTARYRIVNVTKLMYCADPTSPPVALENGFHFEVDSNGWLKWLDPGNAAVADGETITLLYDFHPVYQVLSHPHVTRDDVIGTRRPTDTVTALPIQAAVKLEFLIDVNTPLPPPDNC